MNKKSALKRSGLFYLVRRMEKRGLRPEIGTSVKIRLQANRKQSCAKQVKGRQEIQGAISVAESENLVIGRG